MPRLPTIRVIGSHSISTRPLACCVLVGILDYLHSPLYPVRSFLPGVRHFGSSSTVFPVMRRNPRIAPPYTPDAAVETLAPGGSSMNGMNLSGKPGMVQPMQIPPTFGQPPTPLIHPRFGTLHFTTGPPQPSFTMHFGDPYSVAKSPCS